MGLAWTQTAGAALTIQGNAIDTTGAARVGFANFSRSMLSNELLTVTIQNLQTAGNFFSGGYAGYSLYAAGVEREFVGDLSVSTAWGVQDSSTALNNVVTTNNTVLNTAIFTYNGLTGASTLSLSNGSPSGLVASLTLPTGLAMNSLRFANASGGDMKFGTITVDATVIPEPSSALLGGVSLIGMAGLMRRKRACG